MDSRGSWEAYGHAGAEVRAIKEPPEASGNLERQPLFLEFLQRWGQLEQTVVNGVAEPQTVDHHSRVWASRRGDKQCRFVGDGLR